MSKYTTEVRFICETFAGYDESKGYESVKDIIEKARPKIFDFEYDLFDQEVEFKHPKGLMDGLSELEKMVIGTISLDGDEVAIVPEIYYLDVKESLWRKSQIDNAK